MARNIVDDFTAAETAVISPPVVFGLVPDPVYASFERYKILAGSRCQPLPQRPFNGGIVTTAGLTVAVPQRTYTKWTDGDNVIRTRNSPLHGTPAGDTEQILQYPTPWNRFIHGAWFPRSTASAVGSSSVQDQGTRPGRMVTVLNTTRNREYMPLNPSTKDALVHLALRHYDDFVTAIRTDNTGITSDLLCVIRRGPIFQAWMIESLVLEVVNGSVLNYNQTAVNATVAAVAHFMVNKDTAVERKPIHRKWKTDKRSTIVYLNQVQGTPYDNPIFLLFERLVFQFGVPATAGTSSVEDIIDRAALTYAIIFRASTRAAQQMIHDTENHVKKVAIGTAVLFAAISFAAGAQPVPLLGSFVNGIMGPLNTAVTNHLANRVQRAKEISDAVNNLFDDKILTRARLGLQVPGLLGVLDGDASMANGNPVGDRRRELGAHFDKKCKEFLANIGVDNARMTKL